MTFLRFPDGPDLHINRRSPRELPCCRSRCSSWRPPHFAGDGLVNCSPKSNNGELAVLDPHRVGYLDRTGSGVETIAHMRENGRIVLMFCAFEGNPRIVRVHGRGSVVARDDDAFADLSSQFPHQTTRWLTVGHSRFGGTDLRFVRLRRAAHGLRRPPRPHGRMGGSQGRRGDKGVLGVSQLREPGRSPRRLNDLRARPMGSDAGGRATKRGCRGAHLAGLEGDAWRREARRDHYS